VDLVESTDRDEDCRVCMGYSRAIVTMHHTPPPHCSYNHCPATQRRGLKARTVHFVAYLLKARTVEPEKQPLLANGSETTFVSRQRPRNTTERRPLLGSRLLISSNSRPLLGNGSVNTFPRKRLAYENGVVRAGRDEQL
jgi:hypothetical protein